MLTSRPSLTDGLNTTTLKARLRWWLTTADRTDEGTPVSRRVALAAQSALGQFQVRVLSPNMDCPRDRTLIII